MKKTEIVKAHINEEQSFFCSQCGGEDPDTCDMCETDLDNDEFFCNEEGQHFCSKECYKKWKREQK